MPPSRVQLRGGRPVQLGPIQLDWTDLGWRWRLAVVLDIFYEGLVLSYFVVRGIE